MQLLKDRIIKDGKILPGDIIKVDNFLNHQIDVAFMQELAKEFCRVFADCNITKVLTVEASGIALASITALLLNVPMIFAKKAKSDNIEGGLYQSEIFSYTYKKAVTLLVNKRYLGPEDNVLIIDDFLANGEALRGLVEIINQSGAKLEGIGIAIEKGFQPGGTRLRERGINLHSLAIIEKTEGNKIIFRD